MPKVLSNLFKQCERTGRKLPTEALTGQNESAASHTTL